MKVCLFAHSSDPSNNSLSNILDYKYAYKSINLQGHQMLIQNLIEFRSQKNPYVDNILNIANIKTKHKIIRECEPHQVEKARIQICNAFKLNIDQEIVLNEVTKWFLPEATQSQSEAQKPSSSVTIRSDDSLLIEGLHQDQEQSQEDREAGAAGKGDQIKNSNIILVHGAFGCGKSYLLVAIIRFICHLLDSDEDTETKILVCALTNVAVDRILLTLKDQGFENFGRVGSLRKIHKSLINYAFSSTANQKKADKESMKDLEAMRTEIEALYPGRRFPPNV